MKGSRAQRHFHSPRRPSLTFRLRPWNDLPLEGPSCGLFFRPSGGLSARFGFGALYRSVYGGLMWGLNQNPSPRVDPELEYQMVLTSVHNGVLLAPALQLIVWIWCIFHRCPHQGKPVIIITKKWNLDIRLYRKAFKWGTYQYITDDNQKLVMSWRREPLRTTVAPRHGVPFKSSSKDQITLVTIVHPLSTKILFPN